MSETINNNNTTLAPADWLPEWYRADKLGEQTWTTTFGEPELSRLDVYPCPTTETPENLPRTVEGLFAAGLRRRDLYAYLCSVYACALGEEAVVMDDAWTPAGWSAMTMATEEAFAEYSDRLKESHPELYRRWEVYCPDEEGLPNDFELPGVFAELAPLFADCTELADYRTESDPTGLRDYIEARAEYHLYNSVDLDEQREESRHFMLDERPEELGWAAYLYCLVPELQKHDLALWDLLDAPSHNSQGPRRAYPNWIGQDTDCPVSAVLRAVADRHCPGWLDELATVAERVYKLYPRRKAAESLDDLADYRQTEPELWFRSGVAKTVLHHRLPELKAEMAADGEKLRDSVLDSLISRMMKAEAESGD